MRQFLCFQADPLPRKLVVLQPDGLLDVIIDSLGSCRDPLTPQTAEALVVFINSLAHALLQYTANEGLGELTWPFPPESLILDPLHKVEELAPHGCPAGPVEDNNYVLFGPLTIERWLAEHRIRYPESKLQFLSQTNNEMLQGLMSYVLGWTYLESGSRLIDLAYSLAFRPQEVRLWQALGIRKRFDQVLAETCTENDVKFATLHQLLSSSGESGESKEDQLFSKLQEAQITPGRFYGRIYQTGVRRAEADDPSWCSSGMNLWRIYDFYLTDANGKRWKLIGAEADDGECMWSTEIRCAEQGVLLMTLNHLDGEEWVTPSEDFYTHPIAKEFTLSSADRLLFSVPDVPTETLLSVSDTEFLQLVQKQLPSVKEWIYWLDPTHREIEQNPMMCARFEVIRQKVKKTEVLSDYSQTDPRIWRGESLSVPNFPLPPECLQLQKEIETQRVGGSSAREETDS